jgi:hypothetical protein
MTAKIPETFMKVVNKFFPEIFSVDITEISHQKFHGTGGYSSSFSSPHPYGDSGDIYIVKVRIVLAQGQKGLFTCEGYGQELTDKFKYVYPDMNYVTFFVEELQVVPKPTKKEMVYELFYGN